MSIFTSIWMQKLEQVWGLVDFRATAEKDCEAVTEKFLYIGIVQLWLSRNFLANYSFIKMSMQIF